MPVSSRFLVLVFLLSWVKIGRNVVKVVKKMLYKLVGNSVLPTVSSLITRQIQMARKYFWARKRNVLHPLLLIFKMSNTTEILHFILLSRVPDIYSISDSASRLFSTAWMRKWLFGEFKYRNNANHSIKTWMKISFDTKYEKCVSLRIFIGEKK